MRTYDPEKSDSEVKQADRRRMNTRVLLISVIGGAIILALLFAIYTGSGTGG